MPGRNNSSPHPKALNWLRTGFERQKQGDLAGAAAAYRQSLSVAPEFAAAWANLGIVLRRLGENSEAIDCYRRALRSDAANAGLWGNLGNALRQDNRHQEAVDTMRQSLRLRPESAQVWSNLAITLEELGQIQAAAEAHDRAATLAPDNPGIVWQRCLARIARGDLSPQTWRDYESRWALPGMVMPAALRRFARWRGERRHGRSLLVLAEQGFGDTLLAARQLARLDVADGPVTVRLQPQLRRLFAATLERLGQRLETADEAETAAELVIPIMDLTGLHTPTIEAIAPPLPLSPAPLVSAGAEALFARAGGQLKVGIVWSGNPGYVSNAHRAVALDRFLGFADLPGLQLFSLQLGPPREQLLSSAARATIFDLAPEIADFADTAALLQRLDLTILTDTSVAHLAGTIGAPVWNLLHTGSGSLYFHDRSDSPWYPSMRLFRQSRPGNWDGVFGAVRKALVKLLQQRGLPATS